MASVKKFSVMFYLSVVVNFFGQHKVPQLIVLWIRWELLIFLHID